MTGGEPKRLLVVSGLSGAGKTVALHALEDCGYYCVDNLPVGFLEEFARQVRASDLPLYRRVAVGIDARNPAEGLSRFPEILHGLRAPDFVPELLFFEATDDVLIQRFGETRRRHPLSTDLVSLPDAIDRERRLLGPLSERADLRLDTTRTHLHGLRSLIRQRVVGRDPSRTTLQLQSFGFKHGVPRDADFVFDARVLPNPHWQPTLRDYTGLDDPVRQFLEASTLAVEFIADLAGFLQRWVSAYEQENRSYLTVAVGCTGGRHRSVHVVESLAAGLRGGGRRLLVKHRDLV